MGKETITKYPATYDTIVFNTGISGGLAAKELCENVLKTLVLYRVRMVKHIEDYPTMHVDPWDLKHRGEKTQKMLKLKKQNKSFILSPNSKHWFVNDLKHAYNEVTF